MPQGIRRSLIALALCSSFGTALAAGEAGPGRASTWTDPPARGAAPAKPAARAVAPSTPAAVSSAQRPSRKTRVAAKHDARPARSHVARTHAHRPSAPAPHRFAAVVPDRPVPRWRAYPRYSDAAFPPSYEDERLDRLGTAVGSGYLVMRRRTIEYPDGRVIRFYRPFEDSAD